MKTVPPMPSVAQKGTLGVVQMPRFWCKVLLEVKGQLAEGYSASGAGFDKAMLNGLEIDQEVATQYVRDNLPTYPQFEEWVLRQKGGTLPAASVQMVNERILGYTSTEERLRPFKESVGLDPDFPTTAYHWLIELDDWKQFHVRLTAGGGATKRIPFAVEARGPMGAVQLPRLWSKVLLDAKGLLAEGYVACGNGLDRMALERLSLQREEVVGFLAEATPTYLEFEQWIASQHGPVWPEEVQRLNAEILGHDSPRRAAILDAAGMDPNLNETKAYALNRYDDWAEFHKIIAAL